MRVQEKNNVEVFLDEADRHPPPQHPYIMNNPSAPPLPPSFAQDVDTGVHGDSTGATVTGYPAPQQPYVMNNNTSAPFPAPSSAVVNNNVYVNTSQATVPAVYPVALVVEPPLCCGIGAGWCLFILGWFLGGIPWYAGAIILFCRKVDPRERSGYTACAIFAAIITIMVIILSFKKN